MRTFFFSFSMYIVGRPMKDVDVREKTLTSNGFTWRRRRRKWRKMSSAEAEGWEKVV